MSKPNPIKRAQEIDREMRPDVYDKADAIARIISPAAFCDNWVVHPKDSARLCEARLSYQRAVALRKAHDILRYLGISEEVDWLEILSRISEEQLALE